MRTVTITSLGSAGDGVAEVEDARLHIPYTLPGETVAISGPDKAPRLDEVITASPDRTAAACGHFGLCGGCSLQHLAPQPYLDFKRALVANALGARGLDPGLVAPCRGEAPGGRRRAVFAATRRGKSIVLGFHKRKSHDIVALTECPVMHPDLTASLAPLRDIAADMLGPKDQASFQVTRCGNGLDLYIPTPPKRFGERDAMRVTAAALEAGFIRVGIKGHDTLTREAPRIRAGAADMLPPPGGFLQATPQGEAALAERALDHVAGARKAADLFAGCGTFALRMAQSMSVHAVENHGPAITALDAASRASAGAIHPITTEARDLFRRPLLPSELNRFDAVVIDPPRAGAAAQAEQLAASEVKRIAYVSCSPGTLARDLRLLVDGGYTLKRVTPIDQFVWSAHVEAVAELER